MLQASVSLAYVAGDSIRLRFAVTDEQGNAAIISGDTARFAIARRAGEEPVIGTGDGTAVATITNPTGGLYEVTVEPEYTLGLRGTYRFESELEDVTGNVATVARGFLTFEPGLINA